MLPLGMGRYLAFMMPTEIKAQLERLAGIEITCVPGGEIAKGAGGVHCLTRPIYG
jgi:N-dimethylarginine dimethylaminohydrolase